MSVAAARAVSTLTPYRLAVWAYAELPMPRVTATVVSTKGAAPTTPSAVSAVSTTARQSLMRRLDPCSRTRTWGVDSRILS